MIHSRSNDSYVWMGRGSLRFDILGFGGYAAMLSRMRRVGILETRLLAAQVTLTVLDRKAGYGIRMLSLGVIVE